MNCMTEPIESATEKMYHSGDRCPVYETATPGATRCGWGVRMGRHARAGGGGAGS